MNVKPKRTYKKRVKKDPSNIESSAVETPAVKTPAIETPAVETPAVETPAVKTPAVETPAVETPAVKTPAVETPAVETPAVKTPAVETPAVETPAVETPAVKTPAVETPAVETPAVENNNVLYNFYICTKCDFPTQDNNPNCTNCNSIQTMRLYQTLTLQDAILQHETFMDSNNKNNTKKYNKNNNNNKKNTLPAKYEKFILYGYFLLNSIQDNSLNIPLHSKISLDITSQIHFIDSFLSQFKDIKNKVKLLNSSNNIVDSLIHHANSQNISVQVIEFNNTKYFIDDNLFIRDFYNTNIIGRFDRVNNNIVFN
jgi:hypothetical protein